MLDPFLILSRREPSDDLLSSEASWIISRGFTDPFLRVPQEELESRVSDVLRLLLVVLSLLFSFGLPDLR